MHAEGETTGNDLLDFGFQFGIVAAEYAPTVDDEEHVAISVVDLAFGATATIRVHAVDALFFEESFARVDDAADFGKRTTDFFILIACRDAADMFQSIHGGERAATAVDHIELHFERRMRERQRCDDGTQHHAFPAHRAAHHCHMASRTGKIEGHDVSPLLAWLVFQRAWYDKRSGIAPPWRNQAILLGDGQVRHEIVERIRRDQRRQPHHVRGIAFASHLFHRILEGGGFAVQPLRHARHVRRTEAGDGAVRRFQIADARQAWQIVRVRNAQHGTGFGCGERFQTDTV